MSETVPKTNRNLVLIAGDAVAGKSMALRTLKKPEGVLYLNCENGKDLPFKSKFDERVITTPEHVYKAFEWSERPENAHVHTIVIDSISYLMELFETKYIAGAKDGRAAWGKYAQFLKKLMHVYVGNSTKQVIFIGHLAEYIKEIADGEVEITYKVPIKGAMKNLGVESFFTTIVHAVKVPLRVLKPYENDMLTTNEEEKMLGYKHCFQTRITKDTVGRALRSPMDLWNIKESYIDSDAQIIMDKLHEYYA